MQNRFDLCIFAVHSSVRRATFPFHFLSWDKRGILLVLHTSMSSEVRAAFQSDLSFLVDK